jgi:hypothetical protein
MKKIIIILAAICIGGAGALRADSEDGGYAGAFLKIPVDARPAGMGGAYVAISDDPAGQLHNPAGIQSRREYFFSSSYRAMKLDRQLGFVSLVLPTRLESTLGLSWLYAGYGEVEARNTSGYATGEVISSDEHAFAVSFAKRFTPVFAAGSKVNFYYKQHADLKASSVGINLGAMFYIDSVFRFGTMEGKPFTDLTAGAVISNIAAKYPWDTEGEGLTASRTDDFPMRFAVGVSARTFKKKLLLALDLDKNGEQSMAFRTGGEYNHKDLVKLRSGINDGVFTAGAGFKFDLEQFGIEINYAFSAAKVNEGEDHVFTLDITF